MNSSSIFFVSIVIYFLMRQLTSTVYIIKEDKVLLIFHKKHQRWLPPGGHLEENELPPECAKREALEETGIDIEILRQENVWIDPLPHCRSLERPYLCLLEEIPERLQEPSHQHIDFIFVAIPIGGKEKVNQDETEGLKWFTQEELDDLHQDLLFPDTRQIIDQIFADYCATISNYLRTSK